MDASTPREALCDAAVAGNLGAIRRVLDGGADPNALVPAETADGGVFENTALVLAALKGHLEAAALLLDRGASPDQRNSDDLTPLMMAALNGQAAMVRLLVERGADLTATIGLSLRHGFPVGATVFHFACSYNQPSCVEVLVRADYDTAAKTKEGMTGKMIAEKRGNTAVLERLRDLVAERLGETSRDRRHCQFAGALSLFIGCSNLLTACPTARRNSGGGGGGCSGCFSGGREGAV